MQQITPFLKRKVGNIWKSGARRLQTCRAISEILHAMNKSMYNSHFCWFIHIWANINKVLKAYHINEQV